MEDMKDMEDMEDVFMEDGFMEDEFALINPDISLARFSNGSNDEPMSWKPLTLASIFDTTCCTDFASWTFCLMAGHRGFR